MNNAILASFIKLMIHNKNMQRTSGLILLALALIISLGIYFQEYLGLLPIALQCLFLLIVLASFYIPYQLIDGVAWNFHSTFIGGFLCFLVVFSGYKIEQAHFKTMSIRPQNICGMVTNMQTDGRSIARRYHSRKRLYQFDIVSETNEIQHFRKVKDEPLEHTRACIDYIAPKDSWLYAKNKIVAITEREPIWREQLRK